jgi:hypothetical protein
MKNLMQLLDCQLHLFKPFPFQKMGQFKGSPFQLCYQTAPTPRRMMLVKVLAFDILNKQKWKIIVDILSDPAQERLPTQIILK